MGGFERGCDPFCTVKGGSFCEGFGLLLDSTSFCDELRDSFSIRGCVA